MLSHRKLCLQYWHQCLLIWQPPLSLMRRSNIHCNFSTSPTALVQEFYEQPTTILVLLHCLSYCDQSFGGFAPVLFEVQGDEHYQKLLVWQSEIPGLAAFDCVDPVPIFGILLGHLKDNVDIDRFHTMELLDVLHGSATCRLMWESTRSPNSSRKYQLT
jgi:hypothetical protein